MLVRKVEETIEKNEMLQKGDQVFVALSGGADSVALLLILEELSQKIGYRLEAIHVEHGIRGAESKADADFVRSLCERKGIVLHEEAVDVPAYAREKGLGLEEAARILRYEALIKYGKGAKIALAHHSEDQAETLLFQMVRGCGLKGLCGMLPVRREADGTYIRPLLYQNRAEIEAYLKDKNQDYVTDSTNFDTDYSRNYIRQKVLPELAKLNERASEHIAETAERLQVAEAFLEAEAVKKLKELIVSREGEADAVYEVEASLALDVKGLKRLHPALQTEVLRRAVAEVTDSLKDISAVHIESLTSLANKGSGKMVDLPYDIRGRRSPGILVIEKRQRGAHSSEMAQKRKKTSCPQGLL